MYPSPADKQEDNDIKLVLRIGLVIIIFIVLSIMVFSQVMESLNLKPEIKEVLRTKVGKGIGDIEKVRLVCINDIDCFNETYIDKLEMIKQDCDGDYCEFKLFEEGGINKEFKVKLKKICTEYNETEEGTFCINWRGQTSQEILVSAEAQAKEILNHIASVTLRRQKGTVQIIQIQYYSCLSKSISKAECPAGLSGGLHTRCYLVEAGKSPWDYCSEGWLKFK